MTLGARANDVREVKNVDLANSVVTLRHACAVGADGKLVERSTKTHR